MSSVVVIGAGLAGLATAVRLRQAGYEITLVDRNDRVGASVGRWEQDGFVIDTGPTILTMPQAYRDLFSDTGVDLSDYLQLDPVDPVRRYHFWDGTVLDLPNADSARVAPEMDQVLGPGAGAQWIAVLDRGRAIFEAVSQTYQADTSSAVPFVASLARQVGDLPTFAPHLNLQRLGAQYLTDARLRAVLDRYALDLGIAPRTAPAALVALPYIEHAFGAWQVRGGLHRLPLALAQRGHELGVRLRLGEQVLRIETESARGRSRAQAVRTDRGRIECDAIVCAGDDRRLRELLTRSGQDALVDPAARAVQRRADQQVRHSVFTLFLGLQDPPPLARQAVWFSADPGAELEAWTDEGRTRPADRPTITVHCAPADAQARTRTVRLSVDSACHGSGRHTIDWTATGLARTYGDHLLSVLAERGLDLRPHILVRDHRTPADLARMGIGTGPAMPGATLFGLRRPQVTTSVRGLFLTGGGQAVASLLAEPVAAQQVAAAVGSHRPVA